MDSVYMYEIGYYVGLFMGGAAMGGLIPFVIFAVKKQWTLGFLALALCGFSVFIHRAGPAVAGVLFLIGAIRCYNARN